MTWNGLRQLPRVRRHCLAVVVAGATIAVLAPVRGASADAPPSAATTDPSWLTSVNEYRSMAGLAPVAQDPQLSAGDHDHSCYMLLNGMSHDELPDRAGYTERGDLAGNSGNVAVSSDIAATDRSFVDLWMTGPFHALGLLRPNLETVGFGTCTNPTTSFQAGATLDVIRGLGPTVRQSAPVMFPGAGSTTTLTEFVAETPNPLTFCGWTGPAGLPIVVLMPERFTSGVTASVTGPSGPLELCVLSKHNTTGDARTLLAGNDVVVAIPRNPLTAGTYTVSVASSARNVDWSFVVAGAAADPATAAPAVAEQASQSAATDATQAPATRVTRPVGSLFASVLAKTWMFRALAGS